MIAQACSSTLRSSTEQSPEGMSSKQSIPPLSVVALRDFPSVSFTRYSTPATYRFDQTLGPLASPSLPGNNSQGITFSTFAWMESLRLFHYNREYIVVHSRECHGRRGEGDWHEEPHPSQLSFAVREYAESARPVVLITFLESGHRAFSMHTCPIETLCEEIAEAQSIRLYYRETKQARSVFHAPVGPKEEDVVDELVTRSLENRFILGENLSWMEGLVAPLPSP